MDCQENIGKEKLSTFRVWYTSGTLVHNVREKSVYFSCAFLEKSVYLQ